MPVLIGTLRRRRPKVFGPGSARPLERNAKVRVLAYARAYTARHRAPGQHRGPLTRTILEVLGTLLWKFHNSRDGRCFPSYERIAEAAGCARSTVGRAIPALELAGVLTLENRLRWQHVVKISIAGPEVVRLPRRTSNAYQFSDPLAQNQQNIPKSENRTGTQTQDSLSSETSKLDPKSDLGKALASLGSRIEERRC